MLVGRMSGVERLMECPGHRFLDQVGVSEAARVAAEHGTRLHQIKEGYEDVYLPTESDYHLKVLQDRYAGWQHEVPVTFCLDTRKGYMHKDEASLQTQVGGAGHWLSGHIDAVDLRSLYDGGVVFVNDLKSGQLPVDLDDPQLMVYAATVASAIYLKHREAGKLVPHFVVDLSVLHWPAAGQWRARYLEKDGVPYRWTSRQVELGELREFARLVQDSLAPGNWKKISPGAHCVYCPAHTTCPAMTPEWYRKGKPV